MEGASMGSLHIDVFADGVWNENIIPAVSGDQGTNWLTATVDLAAYNGKTIKIRFRGITGSGFESDIALDDIKLVDQNTISVTEFESLTNTIDIYGDDHLVIHSQKETLNNVVVYDILGRQLFNEIDLHSNKLEIESIKKSNTVLLLKITLENNHVVYRKILF
ncbi:MAG TPA: hypothetical protein DCM10_00305 [Xanthomarina gelatinilytica]|nr:hypothetical protein [Xanthomarina gelatinilytica]